MMEWYYYLSDSFINDVITVMVRDYKVITTILIGPAIVYAVKKWTSWTPWTSDDKLSDMISEKLGLKK